MLPAHARRQAPSMRDVTMQRLAEEVRARLVTRLGVGLIDSSSAMCYMSTFRL